MVTNILTADPPPPPPDPKGVVIRSKFNFFSEYGHVAYHIRGNHKCRKMVASIMPAAPNPKPWG